MFLPLNLRNVHSILRKFAGLNSFHSFFVRFKSNKVRIVEVSPRDGLQNESFLSTDVKLSLVDKLVECGCKTIELTSFVSLKWVPQMIDASALAKSVLEKYDTHEIAFPVLVPNLHGLRSALECGVHEIAVFLSASNAFSKRNLNRSSDESLTHCSDVISYALQAGVRVRAYISCVCGCPYEGEISVAHVANLASQLYKYGCYEISLGDTIGIGTPTQVSRLIESVVNAGVSTSALAVHFHDTYGQALANILTALQLGVRVVDSSVGGLGGCPYAVGASGNVATEDVVYMLHGMKFDTGIDLVKLIDTGVFICKALNKPVNSRVSNAYRAKCQS